MNKYQEALDYLAVSLQVFDETVDDKPYRDELDAKRETARKELQGLVDKATPKKPDVNINNGYCPNCHQAFGLERTKEAMIRPRWFSFCPYCGQAIDWGTYK